MFKFTSASCIKSKSSPNSSQRCKLLFLNQTAVLLQNVYSLRPFGVYLAGFLLTTVTTVTTGIKLGSGMLWQLVRVLDVLLREGGAVDLHVGHIDALARLQLSSSDHLRHGRLTVQDRPLESSRKSYKNLRKAGAVSQAWRKNTSV